MIFRRAGDRLLFLLIRDSYKNWGFPKGHLEPGEPIAEAAIREAREETGLDDLRLREQLATIEWHFRFRGRLIHKTCHLFLLESATEVTNPQREEGITECRWVSTDEALALIAYDNARDVLRLAALRLGEDEARAARREDAGPRERASGDR